MMVKIHVSQASLPKPSYHAGNETPSQEVVK